MVKRPPTEAYGGVAPTRGAWVLLIIFLIIVAIIYVVMNAAFREAPRTLGVGISETNQGL